MQADYATLMISRAPQPSDYQQLADALATIYLTSAAMLGLDLDTLPTPGGGRP